MKIVSINLPQLVSSLDNGVRHLFNVSFDGLLTLIIVNSGGNPVIIQKRKLDFRSKKKNARS